jgi:hypothetical protein
MKPITLQMLVEAGACQDQVDLFEKLFGKSVVPTRELALKHAGQFRWHWASENLLTSRSLKAYDRAIAPAWKAFEAAWPLTSEAFREIIALKTHDEAVEAVNEARAPALKAYNKAMALAFLKQWETVA